MGEADSDSRRTRLPDPGGMRRTGIHKPPPERTSEPPAVARMSTELISDMLSASAGRGANSDNLKGRATHHLPSRRRRDYNWLELTEPMIHELRDELFSSNRM